MRRTLYLFTFVLSGLLFGLILGVSAVQALDLGGNLVKNAAIDAGFDSNTNETSFAEVLGVVVQIALSFVGVIFICLTVYAGYLWMIARGDESLVEKSKSILRASVIGLIITVGAYSIAAFVVPAIVSQVSDGQLDEEPIIPQE